MAIVEFKDVTRIYKSGDHECNGGDPRAGRSGFGIVVLYNLGVMNYVERQRELATLKVLGFRDRHIGRCWSVRISG